jgi:hypothetical protein
MPSIQIATGHPQVLSQSAFQLNFKELGARDDLYLNQSGQEISINRGAIPSPFNAFMMATPGASGSFLVDFDEVPADLDRVEIYIRPYGDSFPSWSLEGLVNPDEIWRNQASRLPGGAKVCIVALIRTESGWSVESLNRGFLEELPDGEGTEGLPDRLKDELEIAGSRGLLGSAKEFEVLIDISASMLEYLKDEEKVPALLESLQGLSAAINKRPIDVSYGGYHSFKLTISDDPVEVHEASLLKILTPEAQSHADSDGYLAQRFEAAPNGTVFLVVTDAVPYLDPEELLPGLRSKDQQIRVLLLAEPLGGTAIGNDPRLSLQVLDMAESQLLNQLKPFV